MSRGLHARPVERGRLDREPSRAGCAGGQRRRRPSRHLAKAGPFRQRADVPEKPARPNCPRPPAERGPPRRRRGAHDGERAHLPANHPRRLPAAPPQRQRERDGPGRVQSPRQDAPGPHHDDRSAGPAEVPPDEDPDEPGGAPRFGWAPLVPFPQAVAVQPQEPARRPARNPAARAPPGPRLVHRRRPGKPALDGNLGVYESIVASVTCQHRSGARRRACSIHALRHSFPGPASCRCPLLAAGDTITHRERHFPGSLMDLSALTRDSTSPNVFGFCLYPVTRGER